MFTRQEQISAKIILLATLILIVGLSADDTQQPKPVSVWKETKLQRDNRMGWWRDSRFGMFVHWGLYSVAAGEFDGRRANGIASWLQHRLEVNPVEYAKLTEGFTADKFDARIMARLARQAGIKYLVITSKHHEGFCLFDSKHTDFDVMNAPAKRDLMREVVDACRAEGLKVGFYYSLIDWHHNQYPVKGDSLHPARNNSRYLSQQRDTDKYVDYMHAQVRELLTNYGKIDIMWFDFSYGKMTGETWRAQELIKMVRSLQPDIIINNRLGVIGHGLKVSSAGGDFKTPEQYIPANGLPGVDWETCMTMNGTWGYKKHDHNWKSTKTLIQNICDIAGKGGNYLLNVGPKSDGTIPQASIDRLMEVGRWMKINGGSIYGTQAGPFPKRLGWGRCSSKKLTGNKTRLYLHVFNWPKNGKLFVNGLQNEPLKSYLLADAGKSSLRMTRQEEGVYISLPATAPDKHVSVVVLDIKGDPVVDMQPIPVAQAADGRIELLAKDAEIHGSRARYPSGGGTQESIGYWIDINDWVSWLMEVDKPGKFNVEISYGCAPGNGGGEYVVEIGGQKITAKARKTKGWFNRVTDKIGTVELKKTGKESLAIRLKTKPGVAVMDLQKVSLVPVK